MLFKDINAFSAVKLWKMQILSANEEKGIYEK